MEQESLFKRFHNRCQKKQFPKLFLLVQKDAICNLLTRSFDTCDLMMPRCICPALSRMKAPMRIVLDTLACFAPSS